MHLAISKGKSKAIERTPLLDEHGSPAAETPSEYQQTESSAAYLARRAWRSHLLTATLVLLSAFFGVVLGIILLAESYAVPTKRNIDRALSHSGGVGFWKEAVPMEGPDAVNVIAVEQKQDATDALRVQINVSVAMRMTVDTDFVMGFREDSSAADGWWTRKWKDVGRWSVRKLGSTTAVLDSLVVYPTSPSESDAPLLTITPLSPIPIPLSPGLSRETLPSSLMPVSIPLLVEPSQNTSQLLEFVKQSWAQGSAAVRICVVDILVHGGHADPKPPKLWDLSRWRNWFRLNKPDVALRLKFSIPPLRIPSHHPTKPGSRFPSLEELLSLESFSIKSAPSPGLPQSVPPSSTIQRSPFIDRHPGVDPPVTQRVFTRRNNFISATQSNHLLSRPLSDIWNIIISAQVSIAHPFSSFAPKINLHTLTLPFVVSLPAHQEEGSSIYSLSYPPHNEQIFMDFISVAKVYAAPTFNTTHIQIPLAGYVLPFSNSSSRVGEAMSLFASSYLSYKPAAIAIFSPLYPSLVVRTSFPPPSERLELLRNVSIENMSIRPGFTSDLYRDIVPQATDSSFTMLNILASATIHARVVLPPGVDIHIDVKRLWIDCIFFDGEVPENVPFQPISRKLAEERETTPRYAFGDPPVPKPRPLPVPLPERAFARITPKNWLNASSSPFPPARQGPSDIGGEAQSEAGTSVFVTAEIVDVPLEVLPGRGNELSKFVSKVLFSSEPVVAGIQGVATVGISVPGLTIPASSGTHLEGSELIIAGLPFEENVRVGGRNSWGEV